jgi:hypothetical protein
VVRWWRWPVEVSLAAIIGALAAAAVILVVYLDALDGLFLR